MWVLFNTKGQCHGWAIHISSAHVRDYSWCSGATGIKAALDPELSPRLPVPSASTGLGRAPPQCKVEVAPLRQLLPLSPVPLKFSGSKGLRGLRKPREPKGTQGDFRGRSGMRGPVEAVGTVDPDYHSHHGTR